MENYTKGEVREVEMPPVFPTDESCIEMRVNAGSKIHNLMGFAMKKIKDPSIKKIIWNGSGKAVTKTVSCAEIMKRKIKNLHQITKLRQRRIEEYWEPKMEGLERLKVNRDIPAISVLLSKDPVDTSDSGYQPPGSFDNFWKTVVQQSSLKDQSKRKHIDNQYTKYRKKNQKRHSDKTGGDTSKADKNVESSK